MKNTSDVLGDIVYVVKYEREIPGYRGEPSEIPALITIEDVPVFITKDREKAEEVVETYVKELCYIDEYWEVSLENCDLPWDVYIEDIE